jgi:hypothetical protein
MNFAGLVGIITHQKAFNGPGYFLNFAFDPLNIHFILYCPLEATGFASLYHLLSSGFKGPVILINRVSVGYA